MKTKKMLVAFEPDNKSAATHEFLYPALLEGEIVFRGLSSGRISRYGMVVMIGKEISERDIFAKVVDSGAKIESVSEILKILDYYLGLVSSLKIGDVVSISRSDDGLSDFSLINTGRSLSTGKSKLP